MQMMKTASSIAFAGVDEKFRVGYYSINNGSGSDFINLSAFDPAQKNLWYTKFFSAVPFGATPLRGGLANTGRMYAGKLTSLNGVSVTDPIQYSCQQNYTILSTDGYWNDASNPKQIDGTTDIGQQDGNDDRPYYDGGSQTRTVSQTTRTDLQVGMNTFLVEQRTQQTQSTSERLAQSVVTTETYPFTQEVTQLRTRTTPLIKSTSNLESRTYPLKVDTKQLQERTFQIQSTTRPLERYTYLLNEMSYPLQSVVTKITKTTAPLEIREQFIQKDTYPLEQGERFIRTRVTPLQQKEEFIQSTTSPLQESVYRILKSTYALQSNTYKLVKSERQLQKIMETSSDGGDTWQSTGWLDASSCTVAASGPGYTRNTQCRYKTAVDTGGQSSCSEIVASPGPTNYTVGLARTCAYETTPVVANTGTCNAVLASGSSPYGEKVGCEYAGTSTDLPLQTSCTAYSQVSTSKTGDKVTCTYETTPYSVTPVSTCTATTAAANTGAAVKKTCGYGMPNSPVNNLTSCSKNDQSANALGALWSGDKNVCAYQSASWVFSPAGCTARDTGTAYSATRISCQFGQTLGSTNSGSWSAYNLSSCVPNSSASVGNKVQCDYESTPATWSPTATCNPRTTADFSNTKIDCRYNPVSTPTSGLTSCTVVPAQSTSSPMAGDRVDCSYVGGTWVGTGSCTARDPGTAYDNSKINCRYGAAAAPVPGNATCTANDQSANAVGVLWSGNQVACAWDATPITTTASPCVWNVPAGPTSTSTQCQYSTTGTLTGTNLSVCTPVPQSTGTANGTSWTGPAKTCTYMAATVATNLPSCSPTGTPNNLNSYTTCGYGAGVVAPNLNSCVVDPPEAGPSYSNGSTTACAYQATYSSTNMPGACSAVAQSPTFAAPEKTCVYAAAVTTSNLPGACVDVPEDFNSGPAKSCYYDTVASVTNLNATTCTANRQAASPFSGGSAVDCTYAAATDSTVTACTTKSPQSGPNYTGGAAVSCAYGTQTGWSDVASGTCSDLAQSTGPAYTGPARECAYNGTMTSTLVGTCSASGSSAPNYNLLQKTVCVPGSFPVVGAPVVNVVDYCSTAPTSSGSPIVVSTATACTYLAPSIADTATCTAVAAPAVSPFVTKVTCGVSDSGFVPVGPTCTTSGTPPSTFDGAGKIVECRTTDQIGTPAAPIVSASCTPGMDGVTKVQTQCTNLLSTGPTPVQSCTPADPPVAPSYVKTTCNTTTTSSNVMGCSAPAPSAPLWETVSCVDNGDGTNNTLADVAAYYYKADLRTSALSNCTGTPVPPATTGDTLCSASDDLLVPPKLNNVPTTAIDNNPAQHMTTFTLGLGASGYMKYSDTYTTDTAGDFSTIKGVSPYAAINGIAADPANGICSWQSSGNCNWPFPTSDEQTTIDDLWHAGVNGRGAYFSATDPESLKSSIKNALNGVAAAGGAASAATPASTNQSVYDSFRFEASYTTLDWTGELVRKTMNPYTHLTTSASDWSAQAKLDAKVSRSIYVYDGSVAITKLKQFTSANFGTNSYFNMPHISTAPNGLTQFLCASPDVCLSSTDQDTAHASGANLVKYLGGDRSFEGTESDNTKYYRLRQHLLGDLVNAQPVYVSQPTFNYVDPGYTEFLALPAITSRQAVVYAASNDGMLHAFAAKGASATEVYVDAAAKARADYALDPSNAALLTASVAADAAASAALASDTVVGQELWAYIPAMVLPNLYKLADKKYKDKHRYYVDGTPEVGDICVSSCSSSSAVWKTILVGGLGLGGRGYYALDITDPASPKALWEFTDANMGYSYGNPQIAKLADGTWVVLISSGYNNIPNADGSGGDGVGRLYVLNAATGAQISGVSPLSTGFGSATNPSGLSKITAQVSNGSTNAVIEAVYGGDLSGNLWRFDVNDLIGTPGYDSQLLAVLKDGTGNRQPITTKPQFGLVGDYKVVFVGTGQYLAASDASDTSTQSFYAIKDTRSTLGSPSTAIFDNPGGSPRSGGTSTESFVQQTLTEFTCPASVTFCTLGSKVLTTTNSAVDFSADNGWFMDFIYPAERSNTDPDLGRGVVAFSTNAPSLLACDVGGNSYFYFLDYSTGGWINAPGNGDPTTGTALVGGLMANQLSSAIKLSTDPSGKLWADARLSGGGGVSFKVPTSAKDSSTRRTSWRQLIRE